MYDVTALLLPFFVCTCFSQAYQYLYMPGDCWFYVTVLMFNIEKEKKKFTDVVNRFSSCEFSDVKNSIEDI